VRSLWRRLTALFRAADQSPEPPAAASWPGATGAGKTLYVGNFLAAVGVDDLREAFSLYGTVTRVEISVDPANGHSRGFGFVEMADGAEAAIAALDGASFRGRTLVVNHAERCEPNRSPLLQILDRLVAHAERPDSPDLREALNDLRELAETGDPEAAEELAEFLAGPGPHYDPEAAYKWYYVALAQQGYSVRFEDQNESPPYYCGPERDFRNESGVSNLVSVLGFDRVRALDAEAAQWLADRNLDGA
jgi:RNA recognition motif-containing protein